MSGRVRLLFAVAAATLVAPATASAATFTVDQAAAPGCAANVCKTITAANTAAADGDTISIKASKTPYVEPPIVITKQNLTIEAQPGGAIVTSNGGVGTTVFRIGNGTAPAGNGTTLKNVFVNSQENGGPAIQVSAAGVTLDTLFIARAAKNSEDASAVLVDTATGTTTVKGSFIFNAPTETADQTAPAVQGAATSSLILQDTVVLSGAKQGDAVALPGNAIVGTDDAAPVANQLVRSTIFATATNANAVNVSSATDSTRKKLVTVDSTTLSGGQNGGGLLVTTAAVGLLPLVQPSEAGDVKVSMVHTTIAGSNEGIAVLAEADGAPGTGAGSVEVTVDRSILKGTVTGTNVDDTPVIGPGANTVKIDVTNSDTAVAASDETGVTITSTGNQNTPAEQLFVDAVKENFHLRIGSPAIDKVAAPGPTESAKDVDGEPRPTGTAADLGSDEFVNKVPEPVITTTKDAFAVNEAAIFDGSKSVDPEAASGGGISKYVWNFGDGTPITETASATIEHKFAAAGSYNVRLAVVDNLGGVSTKIASKVVTVGGATPGGDGVGPTVTITTPKASQVLRLFRVRTTLVKRAGKKPLRRKRRVARVNRFTGKAEDASGVLGVQIALRRVKLASASQTGRCVFFDIKANVFKSLPCSKPRYTNIAFKDGGWAYKLKTTQLPKLRPGTYELIVRATDKTGTVSAPVRRTFTIRTT